ncbi:MAG TPA: Rieske 2Fe-2S domain-containing protein [Gemmatimonadaceae bacterium]|nr:Rieske 2Fe-2S domain-containing protein [Gemmatimonadaceae bacterium]
MTGLDDMRGLDDSPCEVPVGRSLMDRRAFVLACGVAPLIGACARMSYVPGRLASGNVTVSLAELADKPFALVDVPSLKFPIYLHRTATRPDAFTAVLTRCMHRGCTVEPEQGRLVCPCHGSEYTSEGAVLKGPTQEPLIRFAVRVDAADVHILGVA